MIEKNILKDLRTVVWKEWIEWKRQYGNRRTSVLINLGSIIIFGLILPLEFGSGWFDQNAAIYAWLSLPVLLLLRSMGDTFAGERERHTLETLLATRLPNQALYIGKMIIPVIWTWVFTQIVMLFALIPLHFLTGSPWSGYSWELFLSGIFLSLLSSIYAAASGTLLSLRSPTVSQANQKMFLFLILFGTIVVIVRSVLQAIPNVLTLSLLVISLSTVFLVINLVLFVLVAHSFHRKQLLFR